jgi:general secretion pathway protein G
VTPLKATSTRWRKDAGLTILELMVVLMILSIIGVVVSFQVVGQMDRAKVDLTRLQLRQIQSALTLFQLDTRRYPSDAEGLIALIGEPEGATGWRGPYVKNKDLLSDPWGHSLRYSITDDVYLLASSGSDGKSDGDGNAADIMLRGDQ